MVPGLWGAPCKAVSAFAPPISTQDFNLSTHEVRAIYTSYEEGMAEAARQGKPAFIDFTGFGCVNCRKMEAAVWTDPSVADILTKDYVLISLFVDDKTPLAAPIEIMENGQKRTLRTIGDKWSYLQRSKFGANTQPFYVPVDNDGNPLALSAIKKMCLLSLLSSTKDCRIIKSADSAHILRNKTPRCRNSRYLRFCSFQAFLYYPYPSIEFHKNNKPCLITLRKLRFFG